MGKIKNRDQKRAAAKVFSSGGGGGTKGPAVIDKRNQELKCPHCDRVFKQTGRLNDHIKRQHASADGGPDEKESIGASSASSIDITSSTQPRIMDVGSKAGAYDYKSPKLILQELLLRDKVPKARYRGIFDSERSLWRCKVVLPHPKKSEDDIVLFLEQKDACDTEHEAYQRGAVVALHKIAGNRSLERTLPPTYVDLWKSLGERAKAKEEKSRRQEERRQRDKDFKAKALKRELNGQGPSQVIMTQEHREMIEGIIQDVKKSDRGSGVESNEVCKTGESNRLIAAQLTAELETLGFDHRDSCIAASKCGSLSSALDWLCLNVPEEKLPSGFSAGAAGKPVTVLRWNGGRSEGKRGEAVIESDDIVDPALVELRDFGFGNQESMDALVTHKGDVTSSAVSLFLSMCTSGGLAEYFGTQGDYQNVDVTGEIFEEEKLALEAIFGDTVSIAGNAVNVQINDQSVVARVQFVLPRSYPEKCPVCLVKSDLVRGKRMNGLLIEKLLPALVGSRGQPVMYDIVTLVGECLALISASVSEEDEDNLNMMDDEEVHSTDEDDLLDQVVVQQATSLASKRRHPASSLTPSQVHQESERLKDHHQELMKDSNSKILRQRRGLPAASMRNDVIQGVNQNMVTIIMGSTGCGKSTQVPQFILEDAIQDSRGGRCNIICTQPRRISAIGLATRVAQERAEPVGSTVGYSVRLDSKQSKQTRLLFCTTGVMLRRLLGDPDLKSVTHIVLDEVHERTIEGDLLLFLLRDLLRKGSNPNIKIVLMSATAEAELFASYFQNLPNKGKAPPVISIPGFTHPVKDFFLEDVVEMTGYQVGRSSKWAKKNISDERREQNIADFLSQFTGYSESTAKTMAVIDETIINYDIIVDLVSSVLKDGAQKFTQGGSLGAILVFVPGAYLINKLVKTLSSSAAISRNGHQVLVLPLHGGLPPSQQSKVFERPPPGVIKIVVATNVAETSITIDDVTCVIDTGKANEVRFDSLKGISRLQEVFVSQASCQQRRGRAGRVQPGVCYRLFSKATWGSLEKNTLPEISRSALHSLVMDTKAIVGGNVFQVLDNMLTPPPKDGLRRAVQALEHMGAIEPGNQALTPLGKHLTQMPCDPKLGKMLIYGAILRCVDPVLTIAAAQAHGKSVFWSSQDTRKDADIMRSKLVASLTGGSSTKSDHIATIAAYNGWRRVLSGNMKKTNDRRAASMYCTEYFVSEQAMDAIRQGRRQFAQILADLGFVSSSYVSSVDRYVADDTSVMPGDPDEYAGNARVVKAALASGFYPQLLRAENPAAQFQKVHGGAFETEGPAGKVKLFDRDMGRVFIHPSSINFSAGKFESGWLVYSDIMQTSKIFIRECSMVPVYAVLLFGGKITVQHEKGIVIVDDWAKFKAPARIGVLVREMRQMLGEILDKKIQNAQYDITHCAEARLIDAMHHLLSTDGF
jgi:ATP-dependent RNA helicase DHX57